MNVISILIKCDRNFYVHVIANVIDILFNQMWLKSKVLDWASSRLIGA